MSALILARIILLGILALFALHRASLVLLARRRSRTGQGPRATGHGHEPRITVQLPLYNEATVAARLLDAVAALRWPRDRFEVQVLDDSTDETTDVCAPRVAALRAAGIDAVHLRRSDRRGFKAGALQHALAIARGEWILVLDADFVPPPDLLERLSADFADPRVGCVQARWAHLNEASSALTRAQALILDGHFAVEQRARHAAGRFFNFNGTAGVWRRAAIEDAGGWSADTLTEDTDLSYRAQLRGWRLVYRDDVAAPAELPAGVAAFRSQQFRWAKGQTQVAKKLLPRLLAAPLRAVVKLEAVMHLLGNAAYPVLLALCLLALPSAIAGAGSSVELALAAVALAAHVAFYATAGGWRAIVRLPAVMAVCAGLCVSQTRAVLEAAAGRASEFVRTPKQGGAAKPRYRAARSRSWLVEVALGLYLAAAAVVAGATGQLATAPLLALCAAGLIWIGASSRTT